MKIAFFAESCIPIHAYTLDERPLGGTETALIRVADLLMHRGHEVTVFTSHKNPPPSKPLYLPAPAIHRAGPFDILILVQSWKPATFTLPAQRVWFWTGDGPEQYSNYGVGDARVVAKIEKLLAVSHYHRESLSAASGFPIEKIEVVSNGVHLPYFEGEEKREPKRLIFTSAPYRGLSFMPEIFMRVREVHADAELHVFSGMNLYDRETPFEGPHVAHFRKVAAVLQKIPGCTVHGTVTQRALAREYMKSTLYVYPCTVPETCCITALEAQAGGCALVTSERGALRETVGEAGLIVPGTPGEREFTERFSSVISGMLKNPSVVAQYAGAGKARITSEGAWSHVVERIERLL